MDRDEAQRRGWSLMVKTRGGVVSILRDLTLDECRSAYHRLNPDYGHTYRSYEVGNGAMTGSSRLLSNSEAEVREVFGPPDWDRKEVSGWDAPWPQHDHIKLDDPRHFQNQSRP